MNVWTDSIRSSHCYLHVPCFQVCCAFCLMAHQILVYSHLDTQLWTRSLSTWRHILVPFIPEHNNSWERKNLERVSYSLLVSLYPNLDYYPSPSIMGELWWFQEHGSPQTKPQSKWMVLSLYAYRSCHNHNSFNSL